MKKYYITTPIYYVNDTPHIGHAYTTVAADVLSRYHRLRGEDVYFLTGTDEHGSKIEQAAQKAGTSPKEFADHISSEFRKAWEELGISFSGFIRTTDPKHESAVKSFLQKLFDKGLIYKGNYSGLYCVGCEKYLGEADLDEQKCCPDHKTRPEEHSEENYFFKLSAFQDELLARITDESNPGHIAIYPVERRNEIAGKLKANKLEDISMSRSDLKWGIPLPFDEKQTAYVWVDALLNYITAIGFEDNSELFKKLWPADCQLMAKDILWFHSVIWPAMLLGAGLPLPKKVFAHGFFTIDGQKMSKSIGNVIRPQELSAMFGADAARYLVLSLFPFGADGDISWQALKDKYNTDLANNLGNLVNRTLDMLEKFSAKLIPEPAAASTAHACADTILSQMGSSELLLENLEFHRYIAALQMSLNSANQYIQQTAPWKMAKENNPELPAVLFNMDANLKALTVYALPFMPNICKSIWAQLGESEDIESVAREYLSSADRNKSKNILSPRPGTATQKGGILFPRLEKK